MTVPAGLAREQYAGSGSTGPFAFNHKTFVSSHLRVTRTVSGADTLLVLNTDYTVMLAADFTSASVTLISALAVGQSLTVLLDPPIEQIIAYADNDPFPAATHERALDLACMELQALAEKLGRAPLLRDGSSFSDLVLPDPVAATFLGWDAGGTALENKAAPSAIGTATFPVSSVDNSVPRFDGITGKVLQGSLVIVSDTGDVSGVKNQIQTGYLDLTEISAPASPAANVARLFAYDVAGVTKVAVKDSAGVQRDLTGDAEITFIIEGGGGSVITTGVKGDLEIPFNCLINRVTLLADQSGSIVVDIWKDTFANFPPTVADTITASAKPTLSAAAKSQDATLTGWTRVISAGDILRFNVNSVATVTRVTLALQVTKT
jgi:hypothetical protein